MEPRPDVTSPRLSVIVPCFNEEARLVPSLERLDAWLRDNVEGGYEILAVNDGSSDHTVDLIRSLCGRFEHLRLVDNPTNEGKGYAVRTGMLAAHGDIRIFTDADLATPPEEIGRLLEALERAPVAIGTRVHPDGSDMRSGSQTSSRRLLGRLFTAVASPLVGPGVPDTQCGFKGFHADAAQRIFTTLRTRGFVFDIEVLCLARRAGLPIAQVPVRWRDPGGSRLQVRSSLVVRTFLELGRIWWRLRRMPRR